MARLGSNAILGYFPAPPEAIDVLMMHLAPARGIVGSMMTVLDPCAGAGGALAQLGEALGIPPARRHAVELDDGRAELVRMTNPGARVLGPCSIMGCRITPESFGLAWTNPPFSDELGGGGREETAFACRVTYWLKPGGVQALLLPYKIWTREIRLREHFDAWYDDTEVFRLHPDYRKYGEVCVIGTRRARPTMARTAMRWSNAWSYYSRSAEDRLPILGVSPKRYRYLIPASEPPRVFEKREYTDAELCRFSAQSPLNRLFNTPPEPTKARPPLSLAEGHIGLLLAAGHLNGLVEPPGEEPHVVRGSSHKIKEHKETVEEANSTKDIFRERVVPLVRTVHPDGRIVDRR